MGYPMNYQRVLNRNNLLGGYGSLPADPKLRLIAGDLRRLETDAQDDTHVAAYALLTGISEDKVRHLLALFFESSRVGSAVSGALAERWNHEHHVSVSGDI
jgi:hypothetical protein